MENKTVGFDPGAPEGDKTVETTIKDGEVVKLAGFLLQIIKPYL